jgi:plastocyanin
MAIQIKKKNKKKQQGEFGDATTMRYVAVAATIMMVFFGSFAYAQSKSTTITGVASASQGGIVTAGLNTGAGAGGAGAGGGGGGCCGGGGSSTPIEGTAVVAGGVQKITVDMSSGSYNPNTLKLKAGIPAEITFGQASGCTGVVQSQQLGFSENLSSGPKTIKLGALQPGTYGFACGMGMVTGKIVVQ